MSLSQLNTIRTALFAAVNDVVSHVNTEEFRDKIEIVSANGLAFGKEVGLLSKDDVLELEDMFSTTIDNKQEVIDMMLRIFGDNPLDLGPGPQTLVGGDMTNGYFGEVSASELFTASELASLLNLTQGSYINHSINWLKFARYGNIIYIPKRSIRHSTSWNTLNNLNLIYGNNPDFTVEKDDYQFVPRLMTGGISDPSPLNGWGSEWNELIYNVHETNPNQLEIPWDSFTSRDLSIGVGDGHITYCQETYITNLRNIITRGSSSINITGFGIDGTNITHAGRGWRPVLALKQEDGSYSTGREHYPS